MFRKMRRFKQQLTEEECLQILKSEPRGVLSLLGEDGYPYGIPINHYYSEKTGKIYFHGSRQGHKIDAIRNCNKVSLCVYDSGYRKEGEWALNIKSVIVFGKIREMEDDEEVLDILTELCHKFTDDEEYLKDELRKGLKAVRCLELTIEHMTGKLVNES
ncbi:MAG: pyridoxamine 5'-phosphate oxidase family protein [Lachnospiraceae bacterium]|nr:pyridoxamine 5'-phosphate oxidase family protein [Lachnospiraceae bacterium]